MQYFDKVIFLLAETLSMDWIFMFFPVPSFDLLKKWKQIYPKVREIRKILGISWWESKIVFAPFLWVDQNGFTHAARFFLPPVGICGAQCGIQSWSRKRICISQKYVLNRETREVGSYTSAELLFTIAHELRHVWQTKQDDFPENWTSKTFREADAEAFAAAYTFSGQTDISIEDLPLRKYDLAARLVRQSFSYADAEAIATIYEFDRPEKIFDMRDDIAMYIFRDFPNRVADL